MKAVEPDEIIGPAVAGTLAVLNAAHVHGGAVQRVVVLSSTAAVLRVPPPGQSLVLDESSWNEQAITDVKAKGRDADAATKYRASKTLAERAAWEWWEEKKKAGAVGWDRQRAAVPADLSVDSCCVMGVPHCREVVCPLGNSCIRRPFMPSHLVRCCSGEGLPMASLQNRMSPLDGNTNKQR